MKSTVYIESTITSYLCSKPSKESEIKNRQKKTTEWWKNNLKFFDPYISPLVIEEISRGDPSAAEKRISAVQNIPLLEAQKNIIDLSEKLFECLKLPEKAKADSLHIAYAVSYKIDFLISWNFKHIANGWVIRQLDFFLKSHRFPIIVICTPEELTEEPK